MDSHARLLSYTFRKARYDEFNIAKYDEFLQGEAFFQFIANRLDETYLKADYLIKFLSIKYLPSPPPHFNYPHVFHDTYYSIFDLDMPCALESEFQFMYMSLLSFVVYTKPSYFFISEGEVSKNKETTENRCKRVIINLALLSVLARTVDISKDADLPEILLAIIALFDEFFSLRSPEVNNSIFKLFPEFALYFTMFLVIIENNNNTSFETFKKTVNSAFAKVECISAEPHKRLFYSCYGSNLKETLATLQKVFPFKVLRRKLIEFVDEVYQVVIQDIDEKVKSNQMDELPTKDGFVKLSDAQFREITIAESSQDLYTERKAFRELRSDEKGTQTDGETFDFPTVVVYKEQNSEFEVDNNLANEVAGDGVSSITQEVVAIPLLNRVTQTEELLLETDTAPKLIQTESIALQTEEVLPSKPQDSSTQTDTATRDEICQTEMLEVSTGVQSSSSGDVNMQGIEKAAISTVDKEQAKHQTIGHVDTNALENENKLLRQLLQTKEEEFRSLRQKFDGLTRNESNKDDTRLIEDDTRLIENEPDVVEDRVQSGIESSKSIIPNPTEPPIFSVVLDSISSVLKGELLDLSGNFSRDIAERGPPLQRITISELLCEDLITVPPSPDTENISMVKSVVEGVKRRKLAIELDAMRIGSRSESDKGVVLYEKGDSPKIPELLGPFEMHRITGSDKLLNSEFPEISTSVDKMEPFYDAKIIQELRKDTAELGGPPDVLKVVSMLDIGQRE